MKILHVCLANFYIDNYGYQENIITKHHKLQGNEVRILASTESYIDNKDKGYVKPSSYINENKIPVTRIPYTKFLPHFISVKLRVYQGIYRVLSDFSPDIIFLHNTQFLSIKVIVNYVKRNPEVRLYADSHTDFINSAKNWLSKNILHKQIYRYTTLQILPYIKKFYGTLPSRNIFLNKVYNIPFDKIELLELGADDSVFNLDDKELVRKNIRIELGLREEDFVIITGGKLDERKNIHLLMEAVSTLKSSDVKLIVFGTPSEEMKIKITKLSNDVNIRYLGWLHHTKVYDYLMTSDLAFFPGTHSVAWEQCVGIGLPAVFKRWDNITHVDVGGNCIFIDDVNVKNIQETILGIKGNDKLYNQMIEIASNFGVNRFTYSKISKRAIQD